VVEGDDPHRHADLEPGGVPLGQPPLDPQIALELDVAERERCELAVGYIRRRLRLEALRRPGPERAAVGQQCLRQAVGAARGAALPNGEGDGSAAVARGGDEPGGPVDDADRIAQRITLLN
jgi:hypothetical protein